jgi:hypothetical protein
VSAVFDVSESAASITFDQDVEIPVPGSWLNTTFTIHQAARWYETGVVTRTAANVIRITGVNNHVLAGSATIDYDDALHTLIGLNGMRVLSFAGVACPPVA